MNLPTHLVTAAAGTVLVWQYLGQRCAFGFFCCASFLDLDHYIYYALKFRGYNLREAYRYFEDAKHTQRFCLCIFHTGEFLVLGALAALGVNAPWAYACFAGVLLHFLVDLWEGVHHKRMHFRWWSIIDYYRSARV